MSDPRWSDLRVGDTIERAGDGTRMLLIGVVVETTYHPSMVEVQRVTAEVTLQRSRPPWDLFRLYTDDRPLFNAGDPWSSWRRVAPEPEPYEPPRLALVMR